MLTARWFSRTLINRLTAQSRAAVGVAVLLLAGCEDYGTHDVTNDPAYGNFSKLVGVWKTKAPLFLVQTNDTAKTIMLLVNREFYEPNDGGLAELPIGTEIRIEHLVKVVTTEITLHHATGSLVSGPYAGKSLTLDRRLFVGENFNGPPGGKNTMGWDVVPDKLEK